MKKPLFSILIATKNRIPYCINVIERILKYSDQDFELIIQDNSDSLLLFDYAKKITDSRLVYNYTPPPFTSIENFNKVISLSKGKYLCFIGDDDCVSPEIFKTVRWANKNNIDSIVPSLSSIYWWPDATNKIKEKEKDNGHLEIRKLTLMIKEFSTIGEVEKLMKNGASKYLNLIKQKTGNFIGGLSPDIYLAVALSTVINKIVRIDYPLTIPGICNASTSYSTAINSNRGGFEAFLSTRSRGKYKWAKQVPKIPTGINVWADTALTSLTDLEEFSLKKKFSVTKLLLSSLIKKQGDKRDIIKFYLNFNDADGRLIETYYIFKLYILKYLLKIYNSLKIYYIQFKRLFTTKTRSVRFKNVVNIVDALELFNNYMILNDISIKFKDIKK